MIVWVEMAECQFTEAGIKDEYGDWGSRGRGDVAVDVITIVGSILWSSPAFPPLGLGSVNARYDDNLFGRDYVRKTELNISSVGFHCQLKGAKNPV